MGVSKVDDMAKGKTTVSGSIEDQLAAAQQELAVMQRFLEKVQTFSDVRIDAKKDLGKLKDEESKLERKLKDVRLRIRMTEDQLATAADGMVAMLEPGPVKFMPLFDRMEKANAQKHGPNASDWREKPVVALRLSPTAMQVLTSAEVLFIGQLQDRILSDPGEWWQKIEGMTQPMAAAVADKLADFVKKGGGN